MDAQNGSLKWSKSGVGEGGCAIAADGKLIVQAQNVLYVAMADPVNWDTEGRVAYTISSEHWPESYCSPALANGRLYCKNKNGDVWCLRLGTDVPVAAAPTFSPPGGTYSNAQSIMISCTTPGAVVHYTADGGVPTGASTPYTVAIAIGSNMTIKAMAVATGQTDSAVATAAYELGVATPTFDPLAGVYGDAPPVTVACATPDAAIHYTTNGSAPTAASPAYTAPVAVGADTTIKAIGTKSGWTDSAVASARYRTGGSVGRMKITFSGYTRSETLTNFPALVVFNESITNFAYGGFRSDSEHDLRFTDSTEKTELNYEIEKWEAGGDSLVWVQVPQLSGPDTYIWATWGDPAASAPAPCTTNGATWEPAFRAVWHMADAGPTTLTDSTTNRNTATQANGVTFRAAGKVDGGTHYDGVDYSCIFSAGFSGISDFTAECWAYIENASFTGAYGMDALRGLNAKPQFLFRIYHAWDTWDGNNNRLAWRIDGSSGGVAVLDNVARSARLNQWLHLTGTWQHGSPGTARFFVNGAEVSNRTATVTAASLTQLCFAHVGYGDQAPMHGALDEVRVSAKARSADWIWASYMTASNSAFTTYQVASDGALSPPQTTHGIPHPWLTGHGIANTNDAAETQDPDGDGGNTLEEYVAGTDPTNRDSCFRVYLTNSEERAVTWFHSLPTAGSNYAGRIRRHDLESCTDLRVGGTWQTIPGYTGILGSGNLVEYTNVVQENLRFYRAKARLMTQ